MLKHLFISNFTLIDTLDVAFEPGFTVITGETGAGKSIIIGAAGLLLGNRADSKQIKTGTSKCIVEATFDIEDHCKSFVEHFLAQNDLDDLGGECTLRREVSPNGKSRAFINDTPVSLSSLKELGEQLMDIHSQHQNLMLNKEDFQLKVLDIFAANKAVSESYCKTFGEYRKALKELEKLKEDIARSNENEDFLRFQQKELTDARLEDDEQERLERQAETMSHAEEIKSALYSVSEALTGDDAGIVTRLKGSLQQLQGIERVYSGASEFHSRIQSCFIELKELAREISNSTEDIDFDQDKLQQTNDRLDLIYTLEKKYHVTTTTELLDKLAGINAELMRIESHDTELSQKQEQVNKLSADCKEKAARLTETRRKAAVKLEKELSKRLIPLGIPNARFKVALEQASDFGATGTDKVTFLFSSNTGSALQSIAQVASGGEISRVMLSLKAMMSHATGLPTIIFDEIDTGVSGRVAEMMALIMKEMGDGNHQVICITHLPQIAAVGIHHYKVVKQETPSGTTSNMTKLDKTERIKEIAQMLSGTNITQAAIDNAKSLLEN